MRSFVTALEALAMLKYAAISSRLLSRPSLRKVLPCTLEHYNVAVVSVGLATLLTQLLRFPLAETMTPLFYAAVAISNWYGGLRPGLLAIALSTLTIDHFLQTAIGIDRYMALVIFILVALLISFLIAALSSALQQAAVALTKLKAGEDALWETQALFESFMRHSPATAFVKDSNGRYIYVNQQVERLLNRKQADWIGLTDFDLFPLQWAQQWHNNDQTVLTTGQTIQTLETAPSDDGEHYYMSFKFPITDGSGRRLLAGMSIDITEQKRLEAECNQLLVREQEARRQAETANRAKDEFLAMVSHELRTPLSTILSWAGLLRKGNLDKATTNNALAVIERNAKVQNQLIKDLLDTARIVQGQLRLTTRPTNLVQVIEAAFDTVRLTADTKMIHLESRLDRVGLVDGDPDRLQQVVWNLLSNAVKFTPNGGRVAVQLLRVDDWAQIQVTDTGIGISPDFLPKVFERFRQSETSLSSGGLGLGLAIARHLVELHGGTIQASSPGVQQGATFTVRLPLIANSIANSKETPCSPALFRQGN